MNLYLDDNSASAALVAALRKAGHHVVRPLEVGQSGVSDARHLRYAIENGLSLITSDQDDFTDLHDLLMVAGGGHGGVVLILFENDAKKDMKTSQIVNALQKLEKSSQPLDSQLIILNHWR